MKKILLLVIPLLLHTAAMARPKPSLTAADSVAMRKAAYKVFADSVNATFRYQQGHVVLPGGIGELTVPQGFRYLDSAQSRRVLVQLWDNPNQESLGMLFPTGKGPMDEMAWAYSIDYDNMGHVDDDADDIKYDELLEEMQNDTREGNADREKAGYAPIYLLGWASNPYYDKDTHALHWAKSLRFGSSPDTVLNYNVRLLGRKGVLVLNAIGEPSQIGEIKASIPGLLAGTTFTKGQQYLDFDSSIDQVAAYSIGGLVAGKVLAKVGLFAVVLKFWKLGLLALAGAWASVKRFFGFGAKE
ncbi:DUF2167 domain-containing protein [Hymenobacter sp. BT770]|uniref:DUF2167 domain-containing protein n=1 Tax=Hymenobacter sp. BT770 TaxID=2886942 RepID=UPI001D12144A|nr:DUF2167 domain-containing protein [Hymenobacter sp. BT770]MCC3152816.1 DUF2167 domain-containing protein [Hymenobacter sp. BT770]MDO3414891.1 DUF2167 domain-containing protein [Hymenobacter sp. BT770]